MLTSLPYPVHTVAMEALDRKGLIPAQQMRLGHVVLLSTPDEILETDCNLIETLDRQKETAAERSRMQRKSLHENAGAMYAG